MKPYKVSFSKQVQQEKQTKKQHEDSMQELQEKKESLENLRSKTHEVQQEARNEENSLTSEENKMKLHYESKIKILDIKVCCISVCIPYAFLSLVGSRFR